MHNASPNMAESLYRPKSLLLLFRTLIHAYYSHCRIWYPLILAYKNNPKHIFHHKLRAGVRKEIFDELLTENSRLLSYTNTLSDVGKLAAWHYSPLLYGYIKSLFMLGTTEWAIAASKNALNGLNMLLFLNVSAISIAPFIAKNVFNLCLQSETEKSISVKINAHLPNTEIK